MGRSDRWEECGDQILIFFQASGKQKFFLQDSDNQNTVDNGGFMEKSSPFCIKPILKMVDLWKNKWRGVTISLRTGGQGQPTPIHTQRPTQPPFQHRHIHKKLLKRSFSHFSTHFWLLDLGRCPHGHCMWCSAPYWFENILLSSVFYNRCYLKCQNYIPKDIYMIFMCVK